MSSTEFFLCNKDPCASDYIYLSLH